MASSAPSVDFKDMLVKSGIGVFPPKINTAWGIYISQMPDTPDQAIAILDSGGEDSNPVLSLNFPHVQILVRGKADNYVATNTKCQQIKDVLLGRQDRLYNGNVYMGVWIMGDLVYIGQDKQRPLFSMNYRCAVEVPPAGSRIPL